MFNNNYRIAAAGEITCLQCEHAKLYPSICGEQPVIRCVPMKESQVAITTTCDNAVLRISGEPIGKVGV